MDAVTRLAHSAETYLQVPEMGHRDGATDSGVETGGAPAGMEEVLLRAGRQQEASWETCDLLLSKVTVLRYSDLEAPEVLRPLGYPPNCDLCWGDWPGMGAPMGGPCPCPG